MNDQILNFYSLQDLMHYLFAKISPSQLLFKKIHLLLEIFVLDIYLHGALANFWCAMLESLHTVEKDFFTISNKLDPEENLKVNN